MGAHLYPFREAEVIAASTAEARPTADYLAAADLLPAFSRKHGQEADDVASLARLLLASVMADGLSGSLAAGAAVNRAADRLAEQRRKHDGETAAGDTLAAAAAAEADGQPLDYLPRASYPRPDRLATVTDADRLATVLAAADLTADGLAMLAVLKRHGDAWGSGHGAASGTPNGPAILAHLAGGQVKRGRRTMAAADAAAAALASLDAGSLPAWVTLPSRNGADAASHDRQPLRDTTIPTSGPASAVVRTVPSGYWVTLADRSVRLDYAAAVAHLASVGSLPAARVATARRDEETRASLGQPVTLAPMRRPAGVGVGMIYGTTSQRAGEGYAEQRPATTSRKRKRDGGIGSPMVTGGTRYGSGPAGKAADAGQRPTAADEAARREAAMTDAQRAHLATLKRASVAAAADLKAATAGSLDGLPWQREHDGLGPFSLGHGRCLPGRVRSDVATA